MKFTGGLPNGLPIYDLCVHPREGDVILATHGRGIYIVDDISPPAAVDAGSART